MRRTARLHTQGVVLRHLTTSRALSSIVLASVVCVAAAPVAASGDDVTPIIQWPVHGGDNQVWTLDPAPDGHVRIVAHHSGKVLDVEYASVDDGARVIQYTGHGGANQPWLLRGVE